MLRAFDKATGKVVAEIPVPANPGGTPMTYMSGGKQYIVLATADGKLRLSVCRRKSLDRWRVAGEG